MIEYLNLIWIRVVQLLGTFKDSPEMLWFLIPLMVTMIAMEFYFGRFCQETLGWQSAVENNFTLLFVALDMLRHLFYSNVSEIVQYKLRLSIALFVVAVAIFLILMEYFRVISEKFAYLISSHFVINLTAVFIVILVYSESPIDLPALIVVFAFISFFMVLAKWVHFMIPKFIDAERLKLDRLEKRLTNVKDAPLKGDEYGIIKDVEVVSVGKKKAVVAAPPEWIGGEVNVILTKEPPLGKDEHD